MEQLHNFAANQTVFGLMGLGSFLILAARCLVGIIWVRRPPTLSVAAGAIAPLLLGIGACLHHLERVRPHFHTTAADIVHPEAAMDLAIELLIINAGFSVIVLALVGVWNYRANIGGAESRPAAPFQTTAVTNRSTP